MPITNNIEIRTLTSGGGTINLPINSPSTLYIIQGAAVLTSNWTIQPQGTPFVGVEYIFRYEADIDLNGNNITIFGETMPETISDKTHSITAYYDGVNWEVNFSMDIAEDGSLPLSVIETNEFRPVPTVSEVMVDGSNSPTILNSVQPDGETFSNLYYRLDANNKFIEFFGGINVTNVDETSIAGDLTVTIMTDADNVLSSWGGLEWRIPITIAYHELPTSVEPTSIKAGYLTKYSTFSNVDLVVPDTDLGTSTSANYRGYVSFKMPYL